MFQELNIPNYTSVINGEDSTSDSKPLNILLIEDNPGDARIVEILLDDSDLPQCRIKQR